MAWKHILICITFFILSACEHSKKEVSAIERLDTFYKTDLPESSLIPYLVAGGAEMVPLLLEAVQDRELSKRRYLIGALGELKDERAVNVLLQLAFNAEELEYIRCDALHSLKKIVSKQIFDEMVFYRGANPEICDQY